MYGGEITDCQSYHYATTLSIGNGATMTIYNGKFANNSVVPGKKRQRMTMHQSKWLVAHSS